jgi:hypothetical protein
MLRVKLLRAKGFKFILLHKICFCFCVVRSVLVFQNLSSNTGGFVPIHDMIEMMWSYFNFVMLLFIFITFGSIGVLFT